MRFLAFIMLFGLGFVVYHLDNQIELLRNKVYDLEHKSSKIVNEPVVVPVKPHPETHDEIVDRVRSEAAKRRQEYCNNHPNLAVRIGCN
jgi:hypothetical protein